MRFGQVPAFDVVSGGRDLLVELHGDRFAELLPASVGLVEGSRRGCRWSWRRRGVLVVGGSGPERFVGRPGVVLAPVAFASGGAGRGVGPAAGAGVKVVRVVDERTEPFGGIQRPSPPKGPQEAARDWDGR